jgi:adenine deaminase
VIGLVPGQIVTEHRPERPRVVDDEEVAQQLDQAEQVASVLGCTTRRPFMGLSFLALSVIPKLKPTDRGLVGGCP